MQFVDLAAQQERISSELRRRIEAVLTHGHYIMGPEVAELESRLAAFSGAGHCISCANGTDALHMAMLALGIGPGDAVLTTPFSFFATVEVIGLVGATPVFVDVDPVSYTMDPDALESVIEDLARGRRPAPGIPAGLRPRAIIPVDLYGMPADYPRINRIAKAHGLTVVADAAQSFGARSGSRRVGSLATVTTTSFFPAKPLGCYGDGGAVLTDDAGLASIVGSLRVHGRGEHKYHNVRFGLNSRLDTLQAAILLAKLEVFEDELRLRDQVAARYTASLPDVVAGPRVPEDRTSAWAQYALMVDGRDEIGDALSRAGIPTGIYYPIPLHLQPALEELGYAPGCFPVSERLAKQVLCLPMHPYLAGPDQDRVVEALGEAITERTS